MQLKCLSLGLLFLAVVATPCLPQQTIAPSDAALIADTVTSANTDPSYKALLDAEYKALLDALVGSDGKVTQPAVDNTKQTAPLANSNWLNASGFDFGPRIKDSQDAAKDECRPTCHS